MTVTVTGGITFSGGGVTFAPGGGEGGSGQAIFGYGTTGSQTSMTNLVSNTGVVGNDVTGVGTARQQLAAAAYG